MVTRKKNRHRSRRSDEEYEELFGSFDGNTSSIPSLIPMFGVMLMTMLILFLPYAVQYSKYGGNRGPDMDRDRKPFDEGVDSKISNTLFRRIYRMKRESFDNLHSTLEPALKNAFFPKGGGTRKPGVSNYLIDTKTRLAIAICFFAGADPYDIMRVNNVGYASVFYSVWVVIDVINASDFLAYSFPDHDEQKQIARAFEAKSGAGFNCVIGAIDGLLICIPHKPAEYFCKMINAVVFVTTSSIGIQRWEVFILIGVVSR